MSYKLEFLPEVEEDLLALPDEIVNEAFEYFEKYKIDPYKYSQKLYNIGNLRLKGYRKTYLANATYRIIIKVEEHKAKIVAVIAIEERENLNVYKKANQRVD